MVSPVRNFVSPIRRFDISNGVSTLKLLNTFNNLRAEGEWLLSSILGCNRIDLYIGNKNVSKEAIGRFNQMFEDILNGRPIQYILGKTEFMGLGVIVNPNVFIPRPETEILVETVLNLVKSLMLNVKCLNILDIGTGSGCIAISLAKYLPNVKIIATDISEEALKVAKQNAILNRVEDRIKFLQGNLFEPLNYQTPNTPGLPNSSIARAGKDLIPNLIVSNPPYIPTGELKDLPKEVKFEPTVALDGGRDGLNFYRRIINKACYYLKYKGYLIMEIGQGQVLEIQEMIRDSNQFELLEAIKDYRGIDRVLVAQWIS